MHGLPSWLHRALLPACLLMLAGTAVASDLRGSNSSVFQIRSLKEIREQNVVMQRWDTSCAAAALATVFTYAFDDAISERFIVSSMLEATPAARVRSRGGFSMLDMKQFVEKQGYVAEAYQHLSIDDVRLFRAPIVPIDVHGYNHYVVVNAVAGDRVLLADPAFGNRSMTLSQFRKVWLNGLAFVITPK
jgi:uncharacterized protein